MNNSKLINKLASILEKQNATLKILAQQYQQNKYAQSANTSQYNTYLVMSDGKNVSTGQVYQTAFDAIGAQVSLLPNVKMFVGYMLDPNTNLPDETPIQWVDGVKKFPTS